MRERVKQASGVGVLVALVSFVVLNWDRVRDVLVWIGQTFLLALSLPQFEAWLLAVAVGVAAASSVPYFLPPDFSEHRTERMTRLVCFVLSFSCGTMLQPTALGIQYALFAALAAPTLWTCISRTTYKQFPALRPESLMDRQNCAGQIVKLCNMVGDYLDTKGGAKERREAQVQLRAALESIKAEALNTMEQ